VLVAIDPVGIIKVAAPGGPSAGLIVKLKSSSEYNASEPATLILKLNVFATAGVPLIRPVPVPKFSPVGKLPDTTDQLYGVVPPVACRVRLYPVPTVPEDNGLLIVIVGGVGAGLMVKLKSFSEYRALEPVARARKL
jgi:hypothetical protein